jgi:hypothetical protein
MSQVVQSLAAMSKMFGMNKFAVYSVTRDSGADEPILAYWLAFVANGVRSALEVWTCRLGLGV